MRMYRAFGSYRRSFVVGFVALSFAWWLVPFARAQPPSDIGRSVQDCIPGIMNGFMTEYFDLVAKRTLDAHHASPDSNLGRQIATARERTRQVIGEFEADELTPAKMKSALQLVPNLAAHLDVYDAEVKRLQQSGTNPASTAERAWLRTRDAADGSRMVSDPDQVTAFKAKAIVFAVDYPLNDRDRLMLSPSEVSGPLYSLLDFIALHGVPGVRFPYYGGYRTDKLRSCIVAPGPRDVAGFMAFDAVPYANKPMLDEFYYGHTERLDIDKVTLYFQSFIETLNQTKGCTQTINQADYAALVAKYPVSFDKRTLQFMNEPLTGNLNDAFERGMRGAQNNMQPSIQGIVDAHAFFNTHGCSSPEALKIFGNLQSWIEKEIIGVR